MEKVLLVIFILVGISQTSFAGTFKFNNKNINSLVSLICHDMRIDLNNSDIHVSKVLIDRNQYGKSNKDTRIDISGVCNTQVDSRTKKVTRLGDEISISIDLADLHNVQGNVGIDTVRLNFSKRNNQLDSYELIRLVNNSKHTISLRNSNWATSDSMFSLEKNSKIKITPSRSISAVENKGLLKLGSNNSFYHIWSYQAYGCSSSKNKISHTQCERILTTLNI